MLATLASAALQGIEAVPVQVEVNAYEAGDPKWIMVGLPDTAVKESDDRVASALANSGFKAPRTRMTINLAPGTLRKEGPLYDLPIALGILAATGQIPADRLADFLIAGELGLSGATRPVRGGLAMALLARRRRLNGVVLPMASAREAALVGDVPVFGVTALDQAVRFLVGEVPLKPLSPSRLPGPPAAPDDFSEIKGQTGVRRAVEVAVAGGHNVLIIGPPGAGKSMVAKRVPTIMPEPDLEEFLDILRVQSAAGSTLQNGLPPLARPFRSPHHTISDIGLLGGGTIPGPGEISLADHGVLFLDELPEFKRSVLEVLRQPMEDGRVSISRSAGKTTFPCRFMLVAAMNPCPCGYLGDRRHPCRCSPSQVQRYRTRISGPLLDRIDLHVEAPPLTVGELRAAAPGESSSAIRERVMAARARQASRLRNSPARTNSRMSARQVKDHCSLSSELGDVLQSAMERLNLSARAHDRILKVSRTIADLAGSERIESNHLLEAIQYRSLDRRMDG